MAKLSNVKTLDMVNGEITKVEYGGAVYEKVDGKAQAGDLVTTISSWGSTVVGENHFVIDTRSHSGHNYVDVGNNIVGYQEDFVAYRKTSANPTPSLDERVSTLEQRVDSLEGKGAVTTEGYRLISGRDPKAGDFVKITATDDDDLTVGKYYEINGIDDDNDFVVDGDDGCVTYVMEGEDEFEVYEKVAETTTDTLTHEGAEYTLVDRKAQPGDVVVFTETGGDVFKPKTPYLVSAEGKVEGPNGYGHRIYKGALKRTPANVKVYAPVAPAKPNVESLKVGDYAKVISTIGASAGGLQVGEIVEIKTDSFNGMRRRTNRVEFYYQEGIRGFIDRENLVRLTAEEVAEAKAEAERKQAEAAEREARRKADARWASINRKPNEFKKGDIVRVIDSQTFQIKNGEIGEVGELDNEDGTFRVITINAKSVGNWHEPEHVELIAPAESRFDHE